jgi:hypothetical protein
MKRTNSVPLTETETESDTEKVGTTISAEMDARRPLRASEVVREYVREATGRGNTRFLDRTSRAILGAQALRVIRHGEWDADIILRSVRTFAGTQRNPAFLENWVRTQFAIDQEDGAISRRRAEPKDGGLRNIASILRGLPAVSEEGDKTENLYNKRSATGGGTDA